MQWVNKQRNSYYNKQQNENLKNETIQTTNSKHQHEIGKLTKEKNFKQSNKT